MWQEPENGFEELREIPGQDPAGQEGLWSHDQRELSSANNRMSLEEDSGPQVRPQPWLTP